MTTSKSAFQRNKALAEWWASVCLSPDFESVLIYARSEMMESGITFEQMQGANRFVSILARLIVEDEAPSDLPGPGLVHNMSGLLSKVRALK